MTLETTIWLFCVSSDTHSPGRDTSKRAVSGDISHCYFSGRAFGFKVTGRLTPPEAAVGPKASCPTDALGRGLQRVTQDQGKGKTLFPPPAGPGQAGEHPGGTALCFLPCSLTLQNHQRARYLIWGVSKCAQFVLALGISVLVTDPYIL